MQLVYHTCVNLRKLLSKTAAPTDSSPYTKCNTVPYYQFCCCTVVSLCNTATSTTFAASVPLLLTMYHARKAQVDQLYPQYSLTQCLDVCRMAVLNDFEACGYGVPALQPEDLLMLNDVPARQKVCAECC